MDTGIIDNSISSSSNHSVISAATVSTLSGLGLSDISNVPFSLVPVLSKDIDDTVNKILDTKFSPLIIGDFPDDEQAGDAWRLGKRRAFKIAIIRLRDSCIKRATHAYTDFVRDRTNMQNPTKVGSKSIMPSDLADLFGWYASHYEDWKEFLEIAVPVFLIPLQKRDHWIIMANENFEKLHRIRPQRDRLYDKPRETDFRKRIASKVIRDRVMILFRRYLATKNVNIFLTAPSPSNTSENLTEKRSYIPHPLDAEKGVQALELYVVLQCPKEGIKKSKDMIMENLKQMVSTAKYLGISQDQFKNDITEIWSKVDDDYAVRNLSFVILHSMYCKIIFS